MTAAAAAVTPAPKRRPDVERAFVHLATLAGQTDLSGIQDPTQQWVAVLRHLMKKYGEVGELPPLDGVRIVPVHSGGVIGEWVLAEGASAQHRILYVHGGGWAGGSPFDYRHMTAALSRFSGSAVLAVDYRLSPEQRFPAGLEDCVRALEWISQHGPDAAGESAASVALTGDSAGASLAAATCLEVIRRGLRIPDRLGLIAGPFDNAGSPERVGTDDPIVTPESLAVSVAVYLQAGDSPTDPRVSPVYASAQLLSQYPPTLIQASHSETLLYDSRRFARRLEDAGVRTVLSIWPDLPHVWHSFLGLIPESITALRELADFLKSSPGASR